MRLLQILLLGVLLFFQLNVMANPNSAVVIVSGEFEVSPFTTPKSSCKRGFAAGSSDTFLRAYLLQRGYRVYTAPAMNGKGLLSTQSDQNLGTFGDCPPALGDDLTLNSNGDIQLAGEHLANFIEYLRVRHGIRQVNLVAHSAGGLYARSAIQSLKERHSKIKVLSLIALGTPWQGAPYANPTNPTDPASGCNDLPVCNLFLNRFSNRTSVIMLEQNAALMAELNEASAGALKNIPVTLIAGTALARPESSSSFWPNDGIVNLSSALAENLSDKVIEHRQCHIYDSGTHSLWVSDMAKPQRPESAALNWNETVANWTFQALQGAQTALTQPNRVGCPQPNPADIQCSTLTTESLDPKQKCNISDTVPCAGDLCITDIQTYQRNTAPVVFASCAEFDSGKMWSPSCKPCNPHSLPENLRSIKSPTGVGLFCRPDNTPCCQITPDSKGGGCILERQCS